MFNQGAGDRPHNTLPTMTLTESQIFDIIAPVVESWNANHESSALAAVLDEDFITISPKDERHSPGPFLADIAALAAVYNFTFGVWVTNSGAPYILL